jgi:hypothetical protein
VQKKYQLPLRERREMGMDEMEEGKQKFLEVVKGTDTAVQVVIPVTSSNSMFLISLTKGPNRKFITISEDDIIDLPNEATILAKVTKTVRDAVAAL